jgi:hypothetical protein
MHTSTGAPGDVSGPLTGAPIDTTLRATVDKVVLPLVAMQQNHVKRVRAETHAQFPGLNSGEVTKHARGPYQGRVHFAGDCDH